MWKNANEWRSRTVTGWTRCRVEPTAAARALTGECVTRYLQGEQTPALAAMASQPKLIERPIVVLGDLPIVEDRLDDRMYLAISRATERVIVCAPRAVLEHDEILYDGLERATSR